MKLNKSGHSSARALKGFTLIEVIVVIAIISILAGTGSIVISGFMRDSRIETNNEKARLVYTGFQNILLDCEIKHDYSLFVNYEKSEDPGNYCNESDIIGAIVFFRVSQMDYHGISNKNSTGGLGDEIHIMTQHKNSCGHQWAPGMCSRSVWIEGTENPNVNDGGYGGFNNSPDKGAAKWARISKAISGNVDKSLEGSYVVALDLENFEVLSVLYREINGNGTDPKTGIYDVNEVSRTGPGQTGKALQTYINIYNDVTTLDGRSVHFPVGVPLVKDYPHEKDIWKKSGIYVGCYPFGESTYQGITAK